MKKQLIGLNTYLYTFSINSFDKYSFLKCQLSKTGKITEVFIDNGFAFEHKQYISL